MERTLVLVKPDGVKKCLIGEIISRFEKAGLKIVGMKMAQANEEFAGKHYQVDEGWAKSVYDKTFEAYKRDGRKIDFKTPQEIGERIQKRNMKFLCEGPVIAIALKGPHAVELARKIVGATEPRSALPGTIRGDFASVESYVTADKEKRVIRNLVHASDSVENAKREMNLWFGKEEFFDYRTIQEMLFENE